MKYVVNKCFGYFSLPNCLAIKFGWRTLRSDEQIRKDPRLIDWVENHYHTKELKSCTALSVVEIPDNATDWELTENNGLESIIAVVDGKIVHI